jgi:hypothetical protein
VSSGDKQSLSVDAPTWFTGIAIVWTILLLVHFFTRSIDGFVRWELLLDNVLQLAPTPTTDSPGVRSGPEFLPQRWPFLAPAFGILLLAAAHGQFVVCLTGSRCRWMLSERLAITLGSGLSVLSIVTLCCGLAGKLSLPWIMLPSVVSGVASVGFLLISRRRQSMSGEASTEPANSLSPREDRGSVLVRAVCLLVIIPFSLWLLLGSVSPPTDFDVREYHLQGPKEWFQKGEVTFLRHNVYTSFPFQSEMLCLAAMVFSNDWWHGALTGQIVLATYQLLSMLCVFAMARRWIGSDAAWIASVLYLTTPWTLRISLIAYAEGSLTFAMTATTMLVVRITQELMFRNHRLVVLCGLLAGSAMASKYTGLLSVILPVGVILLIAGSRSTDGVPAVGLRYRIITVLWLAAGAILIVSPWLFRNLRDTGNPVYPLGYSVFGGDEWSPDMNARWKPAHAPPEHDVRLIPKWFLDVATRNTWTSSILFGLLVPGLWLTRQRRALALIAGMVAWNFLTWWALTHRIDRFWIAGIPLLCVIAGSAWVMSSSRIWKAFAGAAIVITTIFNVWFSTTALVGFHVGLMDLNAARNLTIRSDIRHLNQTLGSTDRVLMVGEAEVFDATFPLLYNTVFDDSLFEEWTVDPNTGEQPARTRPLRDRMAILEELRRRGVTHVYVNWAEILRYRLPGSYGYSEFVQPSRFAEMVEMHVLRPPVGLLFRNWSDLSEAEQITIRAWDGFEQIRNGDVLITGLLYEVESGAGSKAKAGGAGQ